MISIVAAENSDHRRSLGVGPVHVSRVGDSIVVSSELASLPKSLSSAEKEVVQAVLAGRTNVEIASVRGTSVKTIGNQLHAIYRKLGVGSRHELAALLTREASSDGDIA
jgi:DNA-binding NarL/FixJ family response regulator